MKYSLNTIFFVGASLLVAACSTKVPDSFAEKDAEAVLFPDYANCVVPVNIAPMNFFLRDSAEACVLTITPETGDVVAVSGNSDNAFKIPVAEWRAMLAANVGKNLKYDVYARQRGAWIHYKPFNIQVCADSIDRYLTYRLIEPSYMGTGEIGVYQYDLENGVQSVIFDNHRSHKDPNIRGQKCVNCHTAQRNHPENKMFYYRGANGGLILTYNGQVKKINTRTGDMFAGTVYPAWHPNLPLIAFSSNVIKQNFPTFALNKVEPFDLYSDLVLYNIEKNEVTAVQRTRNSQETNPNWSPDGKYLYYNSSDSVFKGPHAVFKMRYNLFRMAFNADSLSWGKPELVYNAASKMRSATYPRVSPDGKYLLFTEANYGTSTQTNKSADLYLMRLDSMTVRALDEINCSTESDSYHDWSKNSKWFVFSSRRFDGNYSRPYFSHIGADGKASKPVLIPHDDPRHDLNLLKCYNVPEFSTSPVKFNPSDFQSVINSEELKATYGSPIEKQTDAVSGATQMK